MPPARGIFPSLPRVSPIGFLRSLLTVGCLWLPLILLQTQPDGGAVVWIARLGYVVLGVLWWVKFVGRLEDAGWWSPQVAGGVSLIIGTLAIGILRQIAGLRAHSYFLFVLSHPASIFPTWLRPTNDYEMLALFLVIQIPLALVTSNPRPEYLATPTYLRRRAGEQPNIFAKLADERRRRFGRKSLGGFPFLFAVLFIGTLWLPLIYIDSVSNGGIGTWISRFGYLVLAFLWLGCASGRIEDAGSIKPGDLWQYCLVVAVASLMPFGVHWVNGYGAVAIFVLIQTPLAFLPTKAVDK